MNKFNMALIGATCALISSQAAWGANIVNLNFSGEVTAGTCDITITEGETFTFAKVSVDNLPAGKASEIKNLTTKVKCATANKPNLAVSGSTISGKNMIFRATSSTSEGYGFMIRPRGTGVTAATFYNESDALKHADNVSHSTAVGTESTKEWTVGMVRSNTATTTTIGSVEGVVRLTATFK
ncbi:fimbrial protein [Providencia alcalifaciens]|uniref:fimbrial protein n=1 Tax=Providencia TaxID=586 RepID=UPI0018E7D33C|nr:MULTISPECIES: fimbrial protein [Providencia]EJD6083038.1 fimbrial protein [Providencia rettgeri]EJD6601742.1 fimbrial protein [Providencia rettgeri]EJD6613060.1 fimbrial protein [Providencia rettgeri]ELL9150087.1 fimbrial protein [Providencia rettgeri]ELR5227401.1 fimbrial protein [Providencia rettgeri]